MKRTVKKIVACDWTDPRMSTTRTTSEWMQSCVKTHERYLDEEETAWFQFIMGGYNKLRDRIIELEDKVRLLEGKKK